MTLTSNLQTFATRVATESKTLRTLVNGNAADLSALTSTDKSNLVAAINELKATVDGAGVGVAINDAATNTTEVWSSDKISSELSSAISGLIGGAPGALDTLNELAAALADDASYSATVTTALGLRVAVSAQTFTGPQQVQARTNILAASSVDVGDTTANFVTTFEAGLL